ncbi:MAG: DUF1553 domain-containing protein [Gemmataceae bacterium]|nr:DUF1553 domain-containing protein [Gemmataceae bacterium]
MKTWLKLSPLLCGVMALAPEVATAGGKAGKVQFARDIQPILSNYCFTCHGPDDKTRKAGLRLDAAAGATKKLRSGGRAIVPGDPGASELVARIFATEDHERMPPLKSQKVMKDSEKALLKRWIAEGAEFQQHWAFVAPKRPALPLLGKGGIQGGIQGGWPRQPFDYFVLARLAKEGLTPAPEADRHTLARRVALDLTGLPPSLASVDRFVNDKSPNAYEKFVDEVLKSPAYGERWAHVWLDLARYADSRGYATDNPRTIWKYRDWVIEALNANMPFDQFTIEQLAGDLLPKPSEKQLIATAFHRNTLTNDEGGTNDEEFRAAAVVDRVNTTMAVWMGLTMACAQCHTHKYDPITQEEYFRFYAMFNQTQDADRGDESPLLTQMTPQQEQKKAKLTAQLADLEKKLQQPIADVDAALKKWRTDAKVDKLPANIDKIIAVEAAKRTPEQQAELAMYYQSVAPELKATRDRIAALKKELPKIKGITTPIMKELPDKQQRKTKIHIRGNFLDEGNEVTAGLPALFPPLPPGQPLNRLGVARWLVDRNNPLTARVTVNRLWDQLFGVHLVDTPEDFGMRSKPPEHQELLDWLAVEFMDQKWDVQKFLKTLVTSATYRQSSRVTPELLEKDPDNRLFARGPRFRTAAETIRDQALFASGLLSAKMYGPSVRPPRPKLGLTAAFGGGTDWEASPGDDKYRRALYTEWRRTTPYPSMLTFDAPNRNVCTIARPRTNTPLQALVTLNDPVYIEAAQALARRMVTEGGVTPEARVQYGFRLALTRPPQPAETTRLVELYQKARADFAANPKEAQQLATEPLGPLPAGMDAVELAAWTVVGNVMLNLDEVFAKR